MFSFIVFNSFLSSLCFLFSSALRFVCFSSIHRLIFFYNFNVSLSFSLSHDFFPYLFHSFFCYAISSLFFIELILFYFKPFPISLLSSCFFIFIMPLGYFLSFPFFYYIATSYLFLHFFTKLLSQSSAIAASDMSTFMVTHHIPM